MKPVSFFINSNIFISLAAVALTLETQVQLGMRPEWHPYLFIIFFSTWFEYNAQKLMTVFEGKEVLKAERNTWLRNNLTAFYVLTFISAGGFVAALFLAKKEVLIALFPLALLTLLYSFPVFKTKKVFFKLREIPFAKIFVIAFVWSAATIVLPVIQSGEKLATAGILILMAERFVFVFAITIPFDIRDLEFDREMGLKTIPMLVGEKKSFSIAYIALAGYFLIAILRCVFFVEQSYLVPAIFISATSTFIFLKAKKIRETEHYHYGVLDGTMLLQGILVLAFWYLQTARN